MEGSYHNRGRTGTGGREREGERGVRGRGGSGDRYGGRSGGGGGNRGGRGGGRYQQSQYQAGSSSGGRDGGHYQQSQYQAGSTSGGRGGGRYQYQTGFSRGGYQARRAGGQGRGGDQTHAAWGFSSQLVGQGIDPPSSDTVSRRGRTTGGSEIEVGGSGMASVRPVSSSTESKSTSTEQIHRDLGSLKISESEVTPFAESSEEKLNPVKRPDRGGTLAVRSLRLLANHFRVKYNPDTVIMHYDVDIKQEVDPDSRFMKSIPKSYMRLIRDKLFADDPTRFPQQMSGYDGEKSIFSAVRLPTGMFKVELSFGEDMKSRSYTFTINLVSELKLCNLTRYLKGELLYIPRDILQGMDIVMKENPYMHRIPIGKSFFSKDFKEEDDFLCGIAAHKGFQHSLKPTSQGLALCVDYSVLALRKRLPVTEFLREYFNLKEVNGLNRPSTKELARALVGLKVHVTHRKTSQKYTIAGLTDQITRNVSFPLDDPEGREPPKDILLVDYFESKYGLSIMYGDIPCLNLGKNKRHNYVPMEFCVLVDGQVYPKEELDRETAMFLKDISLAPPRKRKQMICDMVRAEDGPCGAVTRNFDIGVEENMTKVMGRVIEPPDLKLGAPNGRTTVHKVDMKCQWNLVGKSVVNGVSVKRWAVIDFSAGERRDALQAHYFIPNLINRCKKLGIQMEEPAVYRSSCMQDLSSVDRVLKVFQSICEPGNKPQIVLCVMTARDDGYKYIKWLSETQVGVLTQCCLSKIANKGNDQYLANLALKINAKLGGSNFELAGNLPGIGYDDHVMFVGADVNHPAPRNSACPSVAAVVATVNWPAVNCYAARVCSQVHRKEEILDFASMCMELVNVYRQINKIRPKHIVIFRDGVSDGQFDMVLNKELKDLKRAFTEEEYFPIVTLIVAQKRHQTRLFLENERDGINSQNVPPGTVVDTIIVHPFENDFYLCSHHGSIGTSKPTHYYVLWNERSFTSDQIQKLIYDLCFTFARCTKPVSLVTPVYYADLAAYRGRIFQEVLMEGSTSSTSSSTATFNQEFYRLHPDLQNTMFFV